MQACMQRRRRLHVTTIQEIAAFLYLNFLLLKFQNKRPIHGSYIAYRQCDAIRTSNDLRHLATERHRINFHIISKQDCVTFLRV